MANISSFEEYSDKYDAWFEKNRAAYHDELEAVRQLLPPPPAKGMEIGIGSGKFAVPLHIKIGIEPSEQMAVKAEAHGIRVVRAVAEKLPFPEREFDFVLMVTTICFVDDILKSFCEAYRILKPQGCIIVGFVDKYSELGKEYETRKQTSVFYRDATFFSAQEVNSLLKNAGFVNLDHRQTLIPRETRQRVMNGFGRGAFVAVRGIKPA